MNALAEKLVLYWAYPFVRYALVVGLLVALCSSLLGVTLVLKRFSFIGDGLSHVAFGGMAVAAVLGMTDDMPLTLGITTVCAILLLRTGNNTKIKGDAAVAMLSVGALAVGYLLMNLFNRQVSVNGVDSLWMQTCKLSVSFNNLLVKINCLAFHSIKFCLFFLP